MKKAKTWATTSKTSIPEVNSSRSRSAHILFSSEKSMKIRNGILVCLILQSKDPIHPHPYLSIEERHSEPTTTPTCASSAVAWKQATFPIFQIDWSKAVGADCSSLYTSQDSRTSEFQSKYYIHSCGTTNCWLWISSPARSSILP